MTLLQQMLVDRVGKSAVEVYNIAHGRNPQEGPCTCNICFVRLEAVSKWLHWEKTLEVLAKEKVKI